MYYTSSTVVQFPQETLGASRMVTRPFPCKEDGNGSAEVSALAGSSHGIVDYSVVVPPSKDQAVVLLMFFITTACN